MRAGDGPAAVALDCVRAGGWAAATAATAGAAARPRAGAIVARGWRGVRRGPLENFTEEVRAVEGAAESEGCRAIVWVPVAVKSKLHCTCAEYQSSFMRNRMRAAGADGQSVLETRHKRIGSSHVFILKRDDCCPQGSGHSRSINTRTRRCAQAKKILKIEYSFAHSPYTIRLVQLTQTAGKKMSQPRRRHRRACCFHNQVSAQ